MSVLESWKTLKMGNSYGICGVICGCRENAQSAPAGVRVQRLWLRPVGMQRCAERNTSDETEEKIV